MLTEITSKVSYSESQRVTVSWPNIYPQSKFWQDKLKIIIFKVTYDLWPIYKADIVKVQGETSIMRP